MSSWGWATPVAPVTAVPACPPWLPNMFVVPVWPPVLVGCPLPPACPVLWLANKLPPVCPVCPVCPDCAVPVPVPWPVGADWPVCPVKRPPVAGVDDLLVNSPPPVAGGFWGAVDVGVLVVSAGLFMLNIFVEAGVGFTAPVVFVGVVVGLLGCWPNILLPVVPALPVLLNKLPVPWAPVPSGFAGLDGWLAFRKPPVLAVLVVLVVLLLFPWLNNPPVGVGGAPELPCLNRPVSPGLLWPVPAGWLVVAAGLLNNPAGLACCPLLPNMLLVPVGVVLVLAGLPNAEVVAGCCPAWPPPPKILLVGFGWLPARKALVVGFCWAGWGLFAVNRLPPPDDGLPNKLVVCPCGCVAPVVGLLPNSPVPPAFGLENILIG